MRTFETEVDKPLVKVTVVRPDSVSNSWNLDARDKPAWIRFVHNMALTGHIEFAMVTGEGGKILYRWAHLLGSIDHCE